MVEATSDCARRFRRCVRQCCLAPAQETRLRIGKVRDARRRPTPYHSGVVSGAAGAGTSPTGGPVGSGNEAPSGTHARAGASTIGPTAGRSTGDHTAVRGGFAGLLCRRLGGSRGSVQHEEDLVP
jgi:hypothetical protein